MLTTDMILEAAAQELAICVKCHAVQDNGGDYARGEECEECGEGAVYGATLLASRYVTPKLMGV